MKFKESIKQKLAESGWDWKAELHAADAKTKTPGTTATEITRFKPGVDGQYHADRSLELMSPEEVRQRANTYINQYKRTGYQISNVTQNADGSVTFTTVKDGKINHHQFHKNGSKAVSSGGITTAGGDDEETKSQKIVPDSAVKTRGRPKGAVGLAKRTDAGMDSGKTLQDILVGKVFDKLPKNVRKIIGKSTNDKD